MKILLADTKAETSTKGLEEKTRKLLSSVLRKWQTSKIHPVYFEKVVSMCIDEVAANRNATQDVPEKKAREKTKSRGSTKSSSKSSKSVSSKSSHTAGGAREEPKPVSSTLLLACLEIFIVLVSAAPENAFLTENAHVVKEILEPCFLRASHRDCRSLRKKLKEFLVPFLKSDFEKKDHDSGITLRIKVLLESFILNSLNSEPATAASSDSLSGLDAARRDEGWNKDQRPFSFDAGRVGGSCLAFFSLDIINDISRVSSSFVESFTGSLVALLEKLVASHLQELASGQRQGGMTSLVGRASSLHQQQPTSTCGIVEEACVVSRTRKISAKESKSNEKSNIGLKRVSYIGTSLKSIVSCMKLICLSDLPFCFTEHRQTFLKTIGSILDSSDNIQLLLTAVGIVGKWLVLKDGSGPLTFHERVTFLRKISCLDSRPISPIVAQSLADLVGFVVLTIAEQGIDNVFPEKTRSPEITMTSELDSEKSQQCFDSTRTLFHRCLVSCVLNAHSSIRLRALSLYGTQADAIDAATSGPDASGVLFVPGRSLFDRLWQLLHSDYEGLCGRMWPLVFVEVLMCGDLPESGAMPEASAWVPRPKRPQYNGSKGCLPQGSVGSFFAFMAKFSDKSETRRRGCLSAVLSLAHGDQSLIQRLFETLMMSAWDKLCDDATRSLLIGPIERLLSRPYHAHTFNHSAGVVNSVQSVLKACRRLNPQPVLDTDLLVSLGGTYSVTHEVMSILEHEFKVLGSCNDSDVSEKVLAGIRICMQQLGEQNLELSLAQKWCSQPETNYVLSLDIHGMVKEAISGYTKLVDLAEASSIDETFRASDFEMDTWEDRWIQLQNEMGQLKVVLDYASAKENYSMLLQAAWKNQDWDKVDTLKSSASLITLCERGDPALKMSEILLAITRGKLSEVENLHSQTAQLCLQQWQSLPNIASGSRSHSALLHFFHRLVEFRESGQIMVETTNHSNRRTLPDLQNLLR
jgi:transformation/transcription domain-associated protein